MATLACEHQAASATTGAPFAGEFKDVLHAADSRPHALVVDDESLIRWCVAETLAEAGWTVREADDRQTAIQAASDPSWIPDLVLLDYRLPDTHDLELLSELRRLRPLCQIMLMTADADPTVMNRALNLGATDVLQKPFEMSDLAVLARRVYNASRSGAAAVPLMRRSVRQLQRQLQLGLERRFFVVAAAKD